MFNTNSRIKSMDRNHLQKFRPHDVMAKIVGQINKPNTKGSGLVRLRHHSSVWLLPTGLLLLALLPLPYGFYFFLRLSVCTACIWLAYEQMRHDGSVGAWVVVFISMALLYNPVLPVYLTPEIWSFINLATAFIIIAHLWKLKELLVNYEATRIQGQVTEDGQRSDLRN